MEGYWRGKREDGRVYATVGKPYAHDAIVQPLLRINEVGYGIGSLHEDYQEPEEYERGQEVRVLQLLELYMLHSLRDLSPKTL